MSPIQPLLLTATRVSTYHEQRHLTNATGFFFAVADRLYLVTSRHVMIDRASGHQPDRLQIELHTDAANLAVATGWSIPLYPDGRPAWRHAADQAGEVDVAAIRIDRSLLPAGTLYRAFTPQHLLPPGGSVEQDTPLLVVGFPLGFHDTLHHLPVARQAGIASCFGLRFNGQGYFLTDARTHRGISGAPVVMRQSQAAPDDPLPWILLGIHSARLDVGTRDVGLDEALGLNCSWYADVLVTLTQP